MNEPQPIDAPRPNHSTGPKTPAGKKTCSLKRRFHSSTNAYRHGLTGQLNILTPDEKQAYDQHSKITLEALAPAGDYERSLAQSIAERGFNSSTNDHWRLQRARTIESGIFAMGMRRGADDTGAPQVDDAFAQARTWLEDARNLQLLTLYEQRIQRAADKNTVRLETLQARRKELAKDDMRQAKLLYQLAQAEGKPYQPEAFFTTAPEVPESVFSTPEVARELDRSALLADARTHWAYSPSLSRAEVAKAAAVGTTAKDNNRQPTTHNPQPTTHNPQPTTHRPPAK